MALLKTHMILYVWSGIVKKLGEVEFSGEANIASCEWGEYTFQKMIERTNDRSNDWLAEVNNSFSGKTTVNREVSTWWGTQKDVLLLSYSEIPMIDIHSFFGICCGVSNDLTCSSLFWS